MKQQKKMSYQDKDKRNKSKRFGKRNNGKGKYKGDDREVQQDFRSDDCTRDFNADGTYNAQKSKANDPRWYAQNEKLLRDTASFSYNYPLGSRINLGPNAGKIANSTSVPGIMTIYTSPSIGIANAANDPVNIAARNIYTYVRHANSGSTNYMAPDLMLYMLAMDSCYSYLEYMKRLYGVMMTYSYTNRYYPMACVYAMEGAFYDIQKNLADFRAYINMFAVKIGSMCIPASMSYMARHMWMYQGYYLDTMNNDKAQTYIYVPEGFYKYMLDEHGAGALHFVNFTKAKYQSNVVDPNVGVYNQEYKPEFGHTVAELIAYGDSLLNPILSSEDMNVMSGDILKAFGPSNVYLVSGIDETYTVLPVYSEEVLNQINNCTLNGRRQAPDADDDITTALTSRYNDITQSVNNGGYLLSNTRSWMVTSDLEVDDMWSYNTVQEAFNGVLQSSKLVNFQHGDISPADTMVATRLMNVVVNSDSELDTITPGKIAWKLANKPEGTDEVQLAAIYNDFDNTGSDYSGYAKIWYYALPNRGNSTNWSLIHSEDIYSAIHSLVKVTQASITGDDIEAISQKNADDFRRLAFLSVFDRHPAVAQLQLYNYTGSDSNTIGATPFSTHINDVNYYTIVDNDNLREMNQTALLSQFNITQYGRSSQG